MKPKNKIAPRISSQRASLASVLNTVVALAVLCMVNRGFYAVVNVVDQITDSSKYVVVPNESCQNDDEDKNDPDPLSYRTQS
jgi:hypothetical protein